MIACVASGLKHVRFGIASVPEEKPVSLAPLDLGKALKGLLGVKPPPKAEKPKRNKVRKAKG